MENGMIGRTQMKEETTKICTVKDIEAPRYVGEYVRSMKEAVRSRL